ncbi:MAG TPA: hypothetical protein DCP68_02870 [Ruminococcus sp.]|nr:hypothetical protein [Ruminococcus sp.]
MRYRLISGFAAIMLSASCCGCTEQDPHGSSAAPEREAETVEAFVFSPDGTEKTDLHFLPDYSQLALKAPEGAEIRYTLDGSVPDAESELYTAPIVLEQYVGDFPHCVVLRAKAYFADGTESAAATQTFWTAFDIMSRFKNPVFSIAGDPAEITEKPDGIFCGSNAKKRGRDSERAVSVEAVTPDGQSIFAQDAGMRVYGGASRESSIKSVKLFARREYDPAHGKFDFDGFGTADAEGGVVAEYDKLVLRNGGNDWQFAFIRDELCQVLAAEAGYTDTEAVMPAVFYLNGEYYGLHWLHETVCDDLLKDKYGGSSGKYVVMEGSEQEKDVPEDDAEEAAQAEAFNRQYAALSALDLTDDANYAQVSEFMDIENYLQFFAFNIYINNNDWPQNNIKCYRWLGDAEDAYGHTDGKWRFWLHDMDYSTGLYGQDETLANYNNLAQILDERSDRYAPMFAALMQREDCRKAFLAEMQRLMDDTLSETHICEVLDRMNTQRFMEMRRYFDHLEAMKKNDSSIWIWYQEYQNRTQNIKNFAAERRANMERFLAEALPAAES